MTGLQTNKEALSALTKQWLRHLKCVGFSYANIAQRIQLSPSAVEQLLRFQQRSPRDQSARQLAVFFLKVFSDPPHSKALQYIKQHPIEINLLIFLTKNIANDK